MGELATRLCLVAAAVVVALWLQSISWSWVVIDPDGFRPNVGIVLIRDDGRVFWARRIHRDGWQFPQGGMNSDETPLEAMYRELFEEVGLGAEDVEVLGSTPGWLRYRLPKRCVRATQRPVCIGQKQVWFLLRLRAEESALRLDASDSPEFVDYRWVDFWYPLRNVVSFKRGVYERALRHLATVALELALPVRPVGPEQMAPSSDKNVRRRA